MHDMLTTVVSYGMQASDVLSELVEKARSVAKEAPGGTRKAPGTLPSLQALFQVGQYVRAIVHKLEEGTASKPPSHLTNGETHRHEMKLPRPNRTNADKAPGDAAGTKGTAKRRVILSLKVAKQNASISKDSLAEGMHLPACIRSAEDHGYTLTLGIKVTPPHQQRCFLPPSHQVPD